MRRMDLMRRIQSTKFSMWILFKAVPRRVSADDLSGSIFTEKAVIVKFMCKRVKIITLLPPILYLYHGKRRELFRFVKIQGPSIPRISGV